MSFQLTKRASASAAAIAVAILIASIAGRAQSPSPASKGTAPEGDVVVGNGYVLLQATSSACECAGPSPTPNRR